MKISYDAEVDALSIPFRETTVTTKYIRPLLRSFYDVSIPLLQTDRPCGAIFTHIQRHSYRCKSQGGHG